MKNALDWLPFLAGGWDSAIGFLLIPGGAAIAAAIGLVRRAKIP